MLETSKLACSYQMKALVNKRIVFDLACPAGRKVGKKRFAAVKAGLE